MTVFAKRIKILLQEEEILEKRFYVFNFKVPSGWIAKHNPILFSHTEVVKFDYGFVKEGS